jgi:hypothetical protein
VYKQNQHAFFFWLTIIIIYVVRFSFIDRSYKCRIKGPQQSCSDVFRTSLSLLFLVRYNFTTNLGSWDRFGLTGHAEDDAALAGRTQGDRLLMKSAAIVAWLPSQSKG